MSSRDDSSRAADLLLSRATHKGARSHGRLLWWFWSLLPWRVCWSIHYGTPAGGLRWEYAPNRGWARRLAKKRMRYEPARTVIICQRVAPWRPGCAMREVDSGEWFYHWPWRVLAVLPQEAPRSGAGMGGAHVQPAITLFSPSDEQPRKDDQENPHE